MTSNPKPIVTIVKPEDKGALVQRPTRVFVGDVELPVKSVYVDLYNGDVDLTLSTQEVRIVREAPTPAEPGDDEAVTVSVTLPAPKPGTSLTGCKCSACDPRGAR